MNGATEKRKILRGGAEPSEPDLSDFPDLDEPKAEPTEEKAPVATLEPDGTMVIKLTKALAPHNGKGEDPLGDLTEIRLRKMFAGDLVAIDKEPGTIGQVIALAKQLSGLPEIAIKRLHADDFARVHGVVNGYLGNFLAMSRALSALSLG